MAIIPGGLGRGPVLPITKVVNTTGEQTFVSLGCPPGATLTITLTGSGAGGGGRDIGGPNGGGGGGGGGGVLFTLSPEEWYPDGSVTLADAGEGGSGLGMNGEDGGDCICEWLHGSVLANGGIGGKATGGVPGAGGLVEFTGTGYVLIRQQSGGAGKPGTNSTGGAGGAQAIGVKGAGGAGGGVTSGFNGTTGQCVIEFVPPGS